MRVCLNLDFNISHPEAFIGVAGCMEPDITRDDKYLRKQHYFFVGACTYTHPTTQHLRHRIHVLSRWHQRSTGKRHHTALHKASRIIAENARCAPFKKCARERMRVCLCEENKKRERKKCWKKSILSAPFECIAWGKPTMRWNRNSFEALFWRAKLYWVAKSLFPIVSSPLSIALWTCGEHAHGNDLKKAI